MSADDKFKELLDHARPTKPPEPPSGDACTWRGALKRTEGFVARGMQFPEGTAPLTKAVTAGMAVVDGALDAGLTCAEKLRRPKPPGP